MVREDQGRLLAWVLGTLDGDRPPWPLPHDDTARLAQASFASGLGALIHWLGAPPGLAPDGNDYLADQYDQCRARAARFATVGVLCLDALSAAGLPAIVVKGPVMAAHWPAAHLRPMADLDLIVRPEHLAAASRALESAGFALVRLVPWEHVHQAWAGEGPLRRDGESIHHPGTIELHPGWVERVHHYLMTGPDLFPQAQVGHLGDAPCWRLPAVLEVAQALGHLSVAALRGEARPVGVVDVVRSLAHLDDRGPGELWRWAAQVDPRLVAPGAWLVERHRRGTMPTGFIEMAMARLGRRGAACLRESGPDDLWRRPGRPSSLRWRHSFATDWSEHLHITRQAIWPPAPDRTSARAVVGRRLSTLRPGRSDRD